MNPNPNHDFNGPIEKTSVELAKAILRRMADGLDYLIIPNDPTRPVADVVADAEKSTDFAIEIMKDISASDLPFDYATKPVEKIESVLNILKGYIGGSVTQYENELVSRTLGVKSPKTGKFRKECATVGALLLKLNEVREAQGNNAGDYFNEAPQPDSTDTAVETPSEVVSDTALDQSGSELSTATDTVEDVA